MHLEPYARQALWRRALLLLLVSATTAGGCWLLHEILGTNGLSWPEAALLVVFGITFAWIALPFWSAVIGFLLMASGRHPITLRRLEGCYGPMPRLTKRFALVMPVYNEEPERVFAGLAATWRSLQETEAGASFDLFVVSDTTRPEIQAEEERIWAETCRGLDANGRFFYRHRPKNVGRKAGNIADWLERWGGAYEGFVVLDADSVMGGETLARLAALMEANPRAGIIQTLALAVGRRTLFARALQFSGRLYGPQLAVGMSFWQLGEANYYGHNAILRSRAFAAHCGLPPLPGRAPLGGEILSHDFVEAALIRRGGWQTWFLPDLGESYEEIPANLTDYATRDRRWAQGNLQHARILSGRGLHPLSRLHLGMGVLAFLVSPLWLLLLVLSSVVTIERAVTAHAYFPEERSLFPIWPEYRPEESLLLLGGAVVLLLAPKLLALLLALARRDVRRSFGGGPALVAGAVAELFFSMLVAPIMMLLHTGFVAAVLIGGSVGWNTQQRQDLGPGWLAATSRHALHSLIGLGWGFLIAWYAPTFLWWIAPVVLGLMLSIPLNVLSGRASLGRAAARLGLFATPEECRPAPVLRDLEETLSGERPLVAPAAQAYELVSVVGGPPVGTVELPLRPLPQERPLPMPTQAF